MANECVYCHIEVHRDDAGVGGIGPHHRARERCVQLLLMKGDALRVSLEAAEKRASEAENEVVSLRESTKRLHRRTQDAESIAQKTKQQQIRAETAEAELLRAMKVIEAARNSHNAFKNDATCPCAIHVALRAFDTVVELHGSAKKRLGGI